MLIAIGFTRGVKLRAVLGLGAVLIGLVLLCVFTVGVGEFAVGTNTACTHVIGNILQDEKIPGVHLAFGDPYGSQTGAPWKSRTHIDVLTRECDVWIDEEQVIGQGRYLMERFGL